MKENRNSLVKLDILDLLNAEYLVIKQPYKYLVKLKENLLSIEPNMFSDFFEIITFKDDKGYLQYSHEDDVIVQNILKKYNINMEMKQYSIIKSKEPNLISVVNYTFIQEYINKRKDKSKLSK